LAVLIVLVLAILALIRVTQFDRIDAKIISICFGSPLAIGLYFLLSRLFRALASGFSEIAGG
jgi:carbon starvation protein CstA